MTQWRIILTIFSALIVLTAWIFMFLSYKRKKHIYSLEFNDAEIDPFLAGRVCEYNKQPIYIADAAFVAISYYGKPLERVITEKHGLRQSCVINILYNGIYINKQNPIFIRRDKLLGVLFSSWAIDKGVEKDGLLEIVWDWNGKEVSLFLRMKNNGDKKCIKDIIFSLLPDKDYLNNKYKQLIY